jgi:hypothetical protein
MPLKEIGAAASFVDGLLSFDQSEPARDPEKSPFDPENPRDSAAKLQQLRVQKVIRELEVEKQKAVEGPPYPLAHLHKEHALGEPFALSDEDFIRADELKDELRKLQKAHGVILH